MRERIFPRWNAALFALLPLSEILYVSVDSQTVYAAALASLICAMFCNLGSKLAPFVKEYAVLRWAVVLFTLWPLSRSVARMAVFLNRTAFPQRPLWILVLLLAICIMFIASSGLIRCSMWALPVAWFAGLVILLSGILTTGDVKASYWQNPSPALFKQIPDILNLLLPAGLAISFSLPDKRLGKSASTGLTAGGMLFALASLRASLLLGPNTAALLTYPNFYASGLAALGDFARHGEVFFAAALILCETGRAAALGAVMLYPFAHSDMNRKKIKDRPSA